MIKRLGVSRYVLLAWMLWLSGLPCNAWADADNISGFSEIKLGADLAAYDTELFNLLSNRKNIINGKNYYEKSFAESFSALLLKSQSGQTKQSASELKRRLLSGPAARPRAFKDSATQNVFLYYDACQAHACDRNNLALLYETQTKLMRAKLSINGKTEFLGIVSEPEKSLLSHLQPNAAR